MRSYHLLLLAVAGVAFLPILTFAATGDFSGSIVPIAVQNCPSAAGWNGLIATLNNVISFAIYFALILCVLMVAYAGFLWVMNPINPENRSAARKALLNAAIGLALTLGAWLIVNTLLVTLTGGNGVAHFTSIFSGSNSNPSNPCITATQQQPITGSNNGFPGSNAAPSGSDQCPGALICTSGTCQKDPQLDNGDGSQGAACVQGSDDCQTGLACDNTDTCNPSGETPPTIPASCSALTTTSNSGTDSLNVSAAVSYLESHYTSSSGSGHCLSAIQYAFQAGGMSLSCPQGYAGQCNGALQSLGFQSLGSSDPSPQAGDIIVVQHTAGNMIGHIAMFTGSNWISDFVQSNNESPPGNPYPASEFGGAEYWRP